jgi:surface protein
LVHSTDIIKCMGNVSRHRQPFIALSLILTLAACSMKDRSEMHSVSVQLPQQWANSSSMNVLNHHSSSMLINYDTPVGMEDFQCYAINVRGSGINSDARMGCTDPSTSVGLVGGFVDVTQGRIDLMVPAGPNRVVELIGIQSEIGCWLFEDLMSFGGIEILKDLGTPYLLASSTVDIFEDTSVNLYASFDENKVAFESCEFSSDANVLAYDPDAFVSEWETTTPSESITLPLRSAYAYNAVVDWGDGSPTSAITTFSDPDATHVYAVAGIYTVVITGVMEAWYFNNSGDKDKILQVIQLGDLGWVNLSYAFNGCDNLTYFGPGNTSMVMNMSGMFLNSPLVIPDTSAWDTSSVTDMSFMFSGAVSAEPDTSGWDTSSVTNMYSMFAGADMANPDVSGWNTSNVTLMGYLFYDTANANPDVSMWDTSSVFNMSSMFGMAQVANPDVSTWDTSSVTDMQSMFNDAPMANPDVSAWNTSSVTNLYGMFNMATSANPDLSNWNFANVNDMDDFAVGTAFTTANYDNLLNAISASMPPSNIILDVGSTQYSGAGTAARAALIALSWTITDGGI